MACAEQTSTVTATSAASGYHSDRRQRTTLTRSAPLWDIPVPENRRSASRAEDFAESSNETGSGPIQDEHPVRFEFRLAAMVGQLHVVRGGTPVAHRTWRENRSRADRCRAGVAGGDPAILTAVGVKNLWVLAWPTAATLVIVVFSAIAQTRYRGMVQLRDQQAWRIQVVLLRMGGHPCPVIPPHPAIPARDRAARGTCTAETPAMHTGPDIPLCDVDGGCGSGESLWFSCRRAGDPTRGQKLHGVRSGQRARWPVMRRTALWPGMPSRRRSAGPALETPLCAVSRRPGALPGDWRTDRIPGGWAPAALTGQGHHGGHQSNTVPGNPAWRARSNAVVALPRRVAHAQASAAGSRRPWACSENQRGTGLRLLVEQRPGRGEVYLACRMSDGCRDQRRAPGVGTLEGLEMSVLPAVQQLRACAEVPARPRGNWGMADSLGDAAGSQFLASAR